MLNLKHSRDTLKGPKLRIIGVEEETTQVEGTENIFNKIVEGNFPNLKKELHIKVQEAGRTSNKLNWKRKSQCHIIIRTVNMLNKAKTLKFAREKDQVTYKCRPIRITPDFPMET